MKILPEFGFEEVKTVIGRYGDVGEVNRLLKSGWVLLDTYTEAFIFDEQAKIFSQRPCFVLGRGQAAGPQTAASHAATQPAPDIELDTEEELDVETIIRLTGKPPGLKRFG